MILDLPGIRAIMIYGSAKYIDNSGFEITYKQNGSPTIKPNPAPSTTEEGGHLLLVHPLIVDGKKESEAYVKKRVSAYAGLFAAHFGLNCAFKLEFENIIECGQGNPSVHSPVFINPLVFGKPNFSPEHFSLFKALTESLPRLDEALLNRLELSLHWFESSTRNIVGMDSFLQMWIAIEVLAMPDTSNIRPLNDLLAGYYGITSQEAAERFKVGRILGLRSRIVHDGEKIPIHQDFSRYLENLYSDLVYATLSVPCQRRAESIIDELGVKLDDLVDGETPI